jgi:hypothetical protein
MPAGVSGAVLLLPLQVSVLGVPSPAVTPTNLLFKVEEVELAFGASQRDLVNCTSKAAVTSEQTAAARSSMGAKLSSK